MEEEIEKRYKILRDEMVDAQLIPRGISDPRVLEVMRKVPRHKFLPAGLEDVAYADCALPIGEGQTISQPYMVAIMTESLKLKGDEKILEIGTGSGYQSAILAELARQVYTIERIESLAQRASKVLKDLNYRNIKVLVGDGTLGLESESPFDGILVTAGAPEIPKTLVEQLADGGRLVIPLGEAYTQVLTIVTKQGTEIFTEESISCVFVPLVGKYGWQKEW